MAWFSKKLHLTPSARRMEGWVRWALWWPLDHLSVQWEHARWLWHFKLCCCEPDVAGYLGRQKRTVPCPGTDLSLWSSGQRLHRTQIIWVCSDIWVFSVLDNRLLADNLSHLPKVLIWIRKGCISSFWNTNALETVISWSVLSWNEIGNCKIR